MQRDIKFRGWDEKSKIMHNDLNFIRSGCNGNDWIVFVSDKNKLNSLPHPLDNPYFSQQIKIMELTGLKDKNGAEIYEGDIIEDHIGRGVVVWWVRNAAFKVSYIGENSGKGKWFADYLDSEYKTIKVIGNIYENPELLKSPD